MTRFLNGEIIEREIRGDSLYSPQESEGISSLYIESFVALSECDKGNPLTAYKCIMNTPELIRRICTPSQVKSIYAIGASESGIKLMLDLGFDHIEYSKRRKDGHKVYCVCFFALSKNIATYADGIDKQKMITILKECSNEPFL
ncbi:MAG TPA: hypothetical protein VM123_06950 [archaeon]|nr:hypothetical protein [archaeon]